jgi:lipopolysaccharide export system protein LptA
MTWLVRKNNTPCYCRTFIIWIIFFIGFSVAVNAQETRKIEYTADVIEMDEALAGGAKRLLGHVVFRHQGAIMYCDSAYYYSETNSLDAFENIYINQGDTIHLYGDFLNYDGNTRLAKIRDSVRLINKDTRLRTDILDYDLDNGIGYYFEGGLITDPENRLRSGTGVYYTRNEIFNFKDSVVINNPDYNIFSDSLSYRTNSKTAFFLGPTEIISDSNYIYCENGWYNTENDISQFNENAFISSNEYEIRGDSLYYERHTGFGEAYKNVEIKDTIQRVILKGNYAIYKERSEEAFLTDSTQMIQVNEGDSLFLHADTLWSIPDTLDEKIVLAYYKVKFFRSNLQGKCDSLVYLTGDSVIQLHGDPVLWTEDKQLSADFIEIFMQNEQIHHMEMKASAFISMEVDSGSKKFNQIKGRDMTAFFRNNDIYRIDVNGNGQTLYYPADDDEYIGVNMDESSSIVIYFKDNQIHRINKINTVSGTMYPLKDAPPEKLLLKGFSWLDRERPKTKEDIFIW